MVSRRDRIAPNCTIRHPVWPIVALQRRVRFSARLAGFCRSKCHQRRARRAEWASFSVFVSNLDFRVPRLRPIGERALTGPCGGGRETAREAQNRGQGHRGVAGLARFGPGAARASLMSIFPQAWIQALARKCGIPFLDVVSPRVPGTPNRRPQRPGEINAGSTFCGAQVEKRPSERPRIEAGATAA